jgi:hypothetical protein
MSGKLKSLAKFVLVMVVMTIACTVLWESVAGWLYDCTDDGFLGFWTPGNWVHDWDNHPVVAASQIVHGRSMSEPDTIKAGWSVTGLWCLWCSFVAISVVVSALLAWKPWLPARTSGKVDPSRKP